MYDILSHNDLLAIVYLNTILQNISRQFNRLELIAVCANCPACVDSPLAPSFVRAPTEQTAGNLPHDAVKSLADCA
jgi:hypothetical protein